MDDYEFKVKQYQSAEITAEENNIEINYLKSKLEGLNKDAFGLNTLITYYEKEYEAISLKLEDIRWKQTKANVILISTKQYGNELGKNIEKERLATRYDDESNKILELKSEKQSLETQCLENNRILQDLNMKLCKFRDEYDLYKEELQK